MVDVCVGLMLVDEVIVKYLCFCEKLIFLVVNKIDGLDFDQVVVDFYLFGLGEIYLIVVFYGCGVLSLLEYVLLLWMEDFVL